MLETPIALTNTFSVGTVAGAQIRDGIAHNPETGRSLPTVNPLVFECNDGFLNDIQRLAVARPTTGARWRMPARISRTVRWARTRRADSCVGKAGFTPVSSKPAQIALDSSRPQGDRSNKAIEQQVGGVRVLPPIFRPRRMSAAFLARTSEGVFPE